MSPNVCTAREASRLLDLEYHTFMARVRRGQYTFEMFGDQYIFDRDKLIAEHSKLEEVK